MPSNKVSINGQEALSWEVSDSKMEAVISVLDAVGERAGFDEQQQALRQSREDHDRTLFGVDEVGVEIDEGGNAVPKSSKRKMLIEEVFTVKGRGVEGKLKHGVKPCTLSFRSPVGNVFVGDLGELSGGELSGCAVGGRIEYGTGEFMFLLDRAEQYPETLVATYVPMSPEEVGVEIDEGGNAVPSSTSIREAKKKKGGVNEAPTTPPPPPPKGQGGTTGT